MNQRPQSGRKTQRGIRIIATKIVGTFSSLEVVRSYWGALSAAEQDQFRLLHVSTDEVYGSLNATDPKSTENYQYEPNFAYSASKAAKDHLVRVNLHAYRLPAGQAPGSTL